MNALRAATVAAIALALAFSAPSARAEIDGHGPDAWRVTGVSAPDRLNARMGPGTQYPVIETFASDERGLQQITCVPFYTPAHYERMTQAQLDALPQRWCLMRNASMSKAGWVAQRFITPDDAIAISAPSRRSPVAVFSTRSDEQAVPSTSDDALIYEAERLVSDLYDAQARAERGQGPDPLQPRSAARYFTADIVALLQSGGFGAHPLYGAQDFDGRVTSIAPDPDQPMFRGMITINVDFINFGTPQRAVFYLRVDTNASGPFLHIFRVEHDGWSYP